MVQSKSFLSGVKNTVLVFGLAIGFVAASILGFRHAGTAPGERGAGHELLGLALVAAVSVHLALHWRWLVSVTRRSTGRLGRRVRVNYILDLLLMVLFATIAFSGVMVSGLLWGEDAAEATAWKGLHHATTKLAIILVSWHLVRHRAWLTAAMRRHFGQRRSQVAEH